MNVPEKYLQEAMKIAKSHDVEKVILDPEYIDVHTKEQICKVYNDEGVVSKRYLIPETVIRLKCTHNDWTAAEVRTKYIGDGRIGFWERLQPHPHISGDGNMCLGDAHEITRAVVEKDYFLAWLMVREFLRNANVQDIAGGAVSRWAEVDENGTVIGSGHDPQPDEYFDGWGTEHDEQAILERYSGLILGENGEWYSKQDCVECEECGCWIPKDEAFAGTEHDYYCEYCFYETHIVCEHCGEPVKINDAICVDGEYYCEDCCENIFNWCDRCEEWHSGDVFYIEGEDVCERCIEDAYTCEECGEYIWDAKYDEETDAYYCEDCYARILEERAEPTTDDEETLGMDEQHEPVEGLAPLDVEPEIETCPFCGEPVVSGDYYWQAMQICEDCANYAHKIQLSNEVIFE